MATRPMVLEDLPGYEARFNARDASLLSFTGSDIDSIESHVNGHVLSHGSGGKFQRTIVNGLGTLTTEDSSYHRYQNTTTLLHPLNRIGTDIIIWQVSDTNVFFPPLELYVDNANRREIRDLGGDNVVNRIQEATIYSSFISNIQNAGTLNPCLVGSTSTDGTKEGVITHSSAEGDAASVLTGAMSSANAEYRVYGRQQGLADVTYVHDVARFSVALDATQRRQAEGIMMWEMGAQAHLHVGHPYRNVRPEIDIPVVCGGDCPSNRLHRKRGRGRR